jgi:TorA maturation chaperone TorD
MAPVREQDPALPRSRVYGLLRRVFAQEVDAALLAWCREQDRLGLWSDLELDLEEVLEGTDSEAVLERLAVDFCQLFITSGGGGSPHESVHVGRPGRKRGKPQLWGDAASEMKDLYREAGFELNGEARQLADALAVELEFMERLSQKEAVAREEESSGEMQRLQELQRRMLAEHLVRWVPDYGRKLRSQAGTAFYRAMLDLAAEFVEWDARRLCGRPLGGEGAPSDA